MPNQSMTVSPSSLRLYDDCQRCFWRYVHMHEHRPEPHFPSLASGMDFRIKNYFDYNRARNMVPPEIASSGAIPYRDQAQLNIWRDTKQGLRWQEPSGNIVMGALDELLEKDGKLIVLDYKTKGWPLKQDDPKRYQGQLDIYAMLLQKNGQQTEDHAYLLYYIPRMVTPNGMVKFDTPLIKMYVDPVRAEKRCLDAIALLNGPMPNAAAQCTYCTWAARQ